MSIPPPNAPIPPSSANTMAESGAGRKMRQRPPQARPQYAQQAPQQAPPAYRPELPPQTFGWERMVEEQMNRSGGRTVGGRRNAGRRAGARYTEGPGRGKTQGQLLEKTRKEYGGMADPARAGWENQSRMGDVRSQREQAEAKNRADWSYGMAGQQPPMPGETAPRYKGAAPGAPAAPGGSSTGGGGMAPQPAPVNRPSGSMTDFGQRHDADAPTTSGSMDAGAPSIQGGSNSGAFAYYKAKGEARQAEANKNAWSDLATGAQAQAERSGVSAAAGLDDNARVVAARRQQRTGDTNGLASREQRASEALQSQDPKLDTAANRNLVRGGWSR